MLKALDRPSDVGVRVIKASKAATIDIAPAARPGADPARRRRATTSSSRFNVFLTYPFVDEVVGRDPQVARNLHMGDYTNLSIELDLDLDRRHPRLPTGLPTPADRTCRRSSTRR